MHSRVPVHRYLGKSKAYAPGYLGTGYPGCTRYITHAENASGQTTILATAAGLVPFHILQLKHYPTNWYPELN